MLKHAKGNLIDMAEAGEFDVIVHGCNCQNVMGSSIAREIRERYPQAFEADRIYHEHLASDYDNPCIEKLGNYSEAWAEKFTIVNAYTQVHYLPRGVDHFEYGSFAVILKKLSYRFPGGTRFGFPYIGMGLAGGDKTRIMSFLEEFGREVKKSGGSTTLVKFA